ncbi:MAG: FtsQ-type POTRA domain-containing protein [Desulfobacterales bacterium]|nr:MAG: FtsQ-type POTRA domain-containing protein [Desulfobacterales bacterium]
MARKQVRKNYYKNSLAQRRQRFIGRCLLSLKIMLLTGGMAGISLLLILAYDAVTQTSYFEAHEITVEGNKELSKQTVLKQAGLKLHENILAVNLNTIRYRLMAHPWVASAAIERALPDTIHIRVKERVPIAIVDLDRLFYVDERGEIFKPVESSDRVRVPVVTGLSLSGIEIEDLWSSPLLLAVMEVLRLSRHHEDTIPCYALHRVHVDREMGVTLYASLAPRNPSVTPVCALTYAIKAPKEQRAVPSAVTIKVGFGGYESKFRRLRHLASYLKQEDGLLNLEFIDLNDSDRVVVRPSLAGQVERRSVAGGRDKWSSQRKEV